MPSTTSPERFVTIDRRSNLTYSEFVSEYRNLGKPVIFTDLSQDWSAQKLFTFDFFEQHFGDRLLEVNNKTYTLREVLHLLKTSTQQRAPYPVKLNLRGDADLKSYLQPRPELINLDRTHSPLLPKQFISGLEDLEVLFGGPGGEFPYLHDDLGYAYINQLHGDKEFTIFPPEQLHLQTATPWVARIADYPNFGQGKVPLFAQFKPIKVVVSAGETLFIPCGWYHTARSLTLTISVAFDQLCCSNCDFFVNECIYYRQLSPLKSKLIRKSLESIGAVLSAYEVAAGKH